MLDSASVSVVIPVYNRSHVLERAIQSCLNNSIKPHEIIIVDDFSNGCEKDRMQEISKKYPLVVFMDNANSKGAQGARNTGAFAATGQWISFLDSDDYFLSDSIRLRLAAAERSGVKVVHSACTLLQAKSYRSFGIPPMQGMIYGDLLRRPAPMYQGMLIRKSALEQIGYLDDTIVSYQEWDTAIRLAKYFEFAFVHEPTFVYDCRGSDTISKDLVRGVNGYKQVVSKHRGEILEFCGRRALAEHYNVIARQYHSLGIKNEFYRYGTKAFLLQPSIRLGLLRRIVTMAKRFVGPDPSQKT